MPELKQRDTKQVQENLKKYEHEKQLQLYRSLYAKSFYEFFKQAVLILEPFTRWEFSEFHHHLCDVLQEHAIRISDNLPGKKDLIVSVPPRTSKSLICSVAYNAWIWGSVNPYLNILTVSHTESLAIDLSFKTRQIIESNWYKELFPHVVLRPDTSSKGEFQNTMGGTRVAFSSNGAITGRGGDILIIDDYLKPQDQDGKVYEQAVKTYKETIYNRMHNPNGLRAIIGQRISENDLTGFLLKNNSQYYDHICLPLQLIYDDNGIPTNVVDTRYLEFYDENGYLWERLAKQADRLKDEIGVQAFNAQYQQNPVPVDGELIKQWWFETLLSYPVEGKVSLFIDTGEKANVKRNDASTILISVLYENIIYIIDIIERWLEFPDLIRLINDTADKYPNCRVYIEPRANGTAIIQSLKAGTTHNIIELPVGRDGKIQRVKAITPKLEAKRVKLIAGAWNERFFYQCNSFPNIKQDGIPDTLAYCVSTLLPSSGNGGYTFHW